MLYPTMESKRPPAERTLVAPPAGSAAAVHFPAAELPPPYIDERLVEPETREEMIDGRLLHTLPAHPEHADQHTELDRVVGTCATPGYTVSTDLLTRVDVGSDFATDTCIRRSGIDPRTGGRYLEEVAFEVVNTQTRPDMVERAQKLMKCGVRRIFAIFVKKSEIGEWSSERKCFDILDPDDTIEDRTLVRPISVRALLDAAEADKAISHALEAKGNPVITEIRAEGHAEGRAEGHAEGHAEGRAEGRAEGLVKGIETACALLGIPLGPRERQRLDGMDAHARATLLDTLQRERRWPRD